MESYILLPKAWRKFTTNFFSKPKPQFQDIFGKDSFPLNTALFQASLLQISINPFLANEWWNAYFGHYSFYASFPSLLARALFVVRYFSFSQLKISKVFPDYFYINQPPSLQYSFSYACRWLLLNNSSIISFLIFLNKTVQHIDEWLNRIEWNSF